ncbi:bifunctional diaminohydroxyphosphoribosylaminopyrimidine deaminase/5-amino-6-(5-phosphoribosylamino)uracil reductase RibD [Psychroserpens damuponensis]|uniref:bifunctional diaminohydroxyphosphoribosylaminopyrimidine deaminase/5-amino-6-(5-phosphoribosylamino)uracil reductase RibD n=1 Tax=Psychroserpens damuponensis TaxID=943936 RepID=UPI00058C816E|nr:bifunctional diaminohydroxyphosphoribosylaminopyrimidine deaminase/5-amino-6-(5-phosphoribosylamino)uracil reductase RibD [Psychroserpens damuponensis]
MKTHDIYIQRCIDIAKNGLGTTAPNPMVGAVIVHHNTIIGEGYTSAYGGPHAEVNAINSVENKTLLNDATLYVTLEPCSHFGKTPPCSDLIIKHNIANVVIGCVDDNPEVAGKGIAKLKAAGCNVTVGVLEAECKQHHQRFFTFHNKKRPYIILKWAETANGFIAPSQRDEKKPVWITNAHSRQLVHKWRAEEQAILVGTNTVLEDNPSLTVRDWTGNNPIKVVIDRALKLSNDHAVFEDTLDTIIFYEDKDTFEKPFKTETGWTVHSPNSKFGNGIYHQIDWSKKHEIAQQLCNALYKSDINSIIIEGGAKTLQTFIDENLWDEARVFKGPVTFKNGITSPKFQGMLISEQKITDDTLHIYVNN